MGMGRRRMSFLEDEREWRLPGLLYAEDLVLYGESDENLRVKECLRKRGLDVRRARRMSRIGVNGLGL